MSNNKYWALIIIYRPHIYSLGKHNTYDAAEEMAQDFCDRKNQKNREIYLEQIRTNTNPEIEIPEPAPYQLAYIMDENDLRYLTGEVHRPFVIAKQREIVEVSAPTRQGVAARPTENDDNDEELTSEEKLNDHGHHNECKCGICHPEL